MKQSKLIIEIILFLLLITSCNRKDSTDVEMPSATQGASNTVLETETSDFLISEIETTESETVVFEPLDCEDYSTYLHGLFQSEKVDFKDSQSWIFVADSDRNSFSAYNNNEGKWRKILTCKVWFGYNGVTYNKVEGDKCTPKGIFDIGFAFGTDDIDTSYEYRKITSKSYWVDDFSSKYYNQWVEKDHIENCDWNSAEKLDSFPGRYDCALVIEYNTKNTIPGAGSAIFLHCGYKNTRGCLAIDKSDMNSLIQMLDKEDIVSICIL